LALPALLVAQTPGTPNSHASATAKEKTALAHAKAKHTRGDVEGPKAEDKDRDRDDGTKTDRDDGTKTRNPNAATPAKRATPAVPAHGEGPATPAKPATPAVPAHKGGHKP
jgi:hypothetical protein